jgi:hypothetical protein
MAAKTKTAKADSAQAEQLTKPKRKPKAPKPKPVLVADAAFEPTAPVEVVAPIEPVVPVEASPAELEVTASTPKPRRAPVKKKKHIEPKPDLVRAEPTPRRIFAPRDNKGNGTLEVRLGILFGCHTLKFTGGPFDSFDPKPGWFGICVRAERVNKDAVSFHLPIIDFSVPKDDELVRQALIAAYRAALSGKSVYIGCMGGYGRTGLFLALLAKVAGYSSPVSYVRANYVSRAVETDAQLKYVTHFNVLPVRIALRRMGWKARLGLKI